MGPSSDNHVSSCIIWVRCKQFIVYFGYRFVTKYDYLHQFLNIKPFENNRASIEILYKDKGNSDPKIMNISGGYEVSTFYK